jgi:enoyl-CoA hydratase
MTTLDCKNHIAFLTLANLPDNKIIRPDFIDVEQLNHFLQTNNCKALIISGKGRHFSSGADLSHLQKLHTQGTLISAITKGKELLSFLYNLNIPVISAIEGACFGGGLEIALTSHIRVVSAKAMLAFPETMQNLMPGLTGNVILRKYLTMGKSIEMLLSNRLLSGEEAVREGLADYVCPNRQTLQFATGLAEKMTSGRPLKVINNVMIAVKNAYELPYEQALEEETKLFCQLAKNMNNHE